MNSIKLLPIIIGISICGLGADHWLPTKFPGKFSNTAHDRAHIVLSERMPELDGAHLKATLVEVNYGPGEASPPHSHPCPVIGYVAEGAIRTQVKGEPEKTLKAGGAFYEPANGVHLVSANASSTSTAKLIAYLLCDRNVPLSVDVPNSNESQNGEQK